jgi:haloalkane dehalogenase
MSPKYIIPFYSTLEYTLNYIYLIPIELRKNEKAYRNVLEKWQKPFLIANIDNDPVTGNNPRLVEMLKRIPSAQEITIEGPGHFIQEEAGPEYA